MTLLRNRLLASTMIAGVTLLAPGLALAQSAPASGSSTTASDKKSTEVEEVVVTGSRIKRNEYTSSAPIQVITSEESTLEGLANTSQMLQQSSLAAGSFQVNNELTGFVTTGGPGVNTISLRGLGATRTLVLLNGRRMPPSGVRGTVGPVDLNTIPDAIVDRVEILKDGASSIYGSDAVAGVVNIITKTNLDGAAIDIYGNQPFKDGGSQARASAVWGKTFDRGYINASVSYTETGALRRNQRSDTNCTADYLFTQTDHQRIDIKDQITGQPQCFNLFANAIQTGNFGNLIYPAAGYTYSTDPLSGNSGGSADATGNFGATPTPFGFVRETRAGFMPTYTWANQQVGPNQTAYGNATIVSPTKLYNAFITGGFDLTADTQAYTELMFNRRVSSQLGVRQYFPGVATNNANVPVAWETPGATRLGSLLPIVPRNYESNQDIDYMRVMAGVRGKVHGFAFLNGWDWDIYGQYGKSHGKYVSDQIYNDRTVAVTGSALACNPSPSTGNISGFNCADVPTGIPFLSQRVLANQFTDAEKAFLFFKNVGLTEYTQQQVEATLTGDLFQLPAGPVGVAVGASWRRDHIDDTPGLQEQQNNLWGFSAAGHTFGTDTVKEYFGEIDVPLLKGVPAFESLDLQASGRHTDYQSYGASNTYKVGLNWQIIPSFRLRATQGTSFRAPALYELFLAHQTSFQGQTAIDPCINYQNSSNSILVANCSSTSGPNGGQAIPTGYTGAGSSAQIITGGGAGVLSAETSKAKTIGAIWTPKFIDLSVAVDYSDIVVNNEVTRFGAANIVAGCYTTANFNSPFCSTDFFQRDNNPFLDSSGHGTTVNTGTANPAFHRIIYVNNNYTNIATQINHALDLTTRYRHDFDFGRLTINGQFTWQMKNQVQLSSRFAPTDSNGSTLNPDFNGITTVRFDHGDWTVFWSSQFIAKNSDAGFNGTGDTGNSTRYSTTCTFAGQGVHNCNDPTYFGHFAIQAVSNTPIYIKRYAEFTAYHTISVRKKFDTWTVQAGVQNLFDERPPSLSSGETRIGTTAVFNYDEIGRRAFFEVSKRW